MNVEARLAQLESIVLRVAPGSIAPQRSYLAENPGQVIATEVTLALLRGEPGLTHSPESAQFALAVRLGVFPGDAEGYDSFMAWTAGSTTQRRIESRQYLVQALVDYQVLTQEFVVGVEKRLIMCAQNGWDVDTLAMHAAYALVAE